MKTYLFLFLHLSLLFSLFICLVKERDNISLLSFGGGIFKHRVMELLQCSITLGQLVTQCMNYSELNDTQLYGAGCMYIFELT